MSTTTAEILFGSDLVKDWHMQDVERAVLLLVLERVKPEISIEVGTFLGGSLRPISRASKYVYTFDIDPNQHRVRGDFANVNFVTGDTAATLMPVIDQINKSQDEINFILIDGSHEEDGVLNDINSCIRYVPKRTPTIILMHDSSNPDVRRAIQRADWASSPYIHELNLDLVPGMLYNRQDIAGQIWGGLASALMLPVKRVGDVLLRAGFEHSLQALMAASAYR